MTTKGTKEWADSNVNFQQGCPNGCQYCYAAQMAIRFKRFESLKDWTENWWIDQKKVEKGYGRRKGRIMFPTSHDLTKFNYRKAMLVLRKILEAGNNILITSKPVFGIIQRICDEFKKFKTQIQFRFTIGSVQDNILQLWEPNAPSFRERVQSVRYAFKNKYKTSLSIEPYLDESFGNIILSLRDQITESIWLGILNTTMLPPEGRKLYNKEKKYYDRIYSKKYLKKEIPYVRKLAQGKLRLKDSIRNLIGEN
jgi:DNA repair photolyase